MSDDALRDAIDMWSKPDHTYPAMVDLRADGSVAFAPLSAWGDAVSEVRLVRGAGPMWRVEVVSTTIVADTLTTNLTIMEPRPRVAASDAAAGEGKR